MNFKLKWNENFQEKYNDCELIKGLKLEEEFHVIEYSEKGVEYCDEIEFLVGSYQYPIICRRKKGKGFVYSICTKSRHSPTCFASNLIK